MASGAAQGKGRTLCARRRGAGKGSVCARMLLAMKKPKGHELLRTKREERGEAERATAGRDIQGKCAPGVPYVLGKATLPRF